MAAVVILFPSFVGSTGTLLLCLCTLAGHRISEDTLTSWDLTQQSSGVFVVTWETFLRLTWKRKLLAISTLPVERQAALRTELHLRTEGGEWLKGLEANVRAWQHTRYSKATNLLLHPMFRWIAELAYQTWLSYYQWTRKRREAKD